MNKFEGMRYQAKSFQWSVKEGVGTLIFDRPTKKNPISIEVYLELTSLFQKLADSIDVKAVVINGAGGNFCSGGDVHETIGPLIEMRKRQDIAGVLAFSKMTGSLVKAMRHCPQPIISAVDGICVGAGAIVAMASDIRYGTPRTKTAFLFVRVGVSGADMGVCSILPRIIGSGRAAELLYSGRMMSAEEGERWGFYSRLIEPEEVLAQAQAFALTLASGPTFAHAITKASLHQEWSMDIDAAIDAEAQVQTLCMLTSDFERAYRAFVDKTPVVFEGN